MDLDLVSVIHKLARLPLCVPMPMVLSTFMRGSFVEKDEIGLRCFGYYYLLTQKDNDKRY